MMGKDPFKRAKNLGLCVGMLHPPCYDLVNVATAQTLRPQVTFFAKTQVHLVASTLVARLNLF